MHWNFCFSVSVTGFLVFSNPSHIDYNIFMSVEHTIPNDHNFKCKYNSLMYKNTYFSVTKACLNFIFISYELRVFGVDEPQLSYTIYT